jgi:hypothetical protein
LTSAARPSQIGIPAGFGNHHCMAVATALLFMAANREQGWASRDWTCQNGFDLANRWRITSTW